MYSVTGDLQIRFIRPCGNSVGARTGAFRVAFCLDIDQETPSEVIVPPAALESFRAFRRAVAKYGFWPRWQAEFAPSRIQAEVWADEVQRALKSGEPIQLPSDEG
jgi:hypothetical protein